MQLRDKRVLVVGLGASGRAAARLCLAQGARVTATDSRGPEQLGELRGLRDRVTLELGGHRPQIFQQAQLIVLSPGVPPLPELQAARAAGIPVIGEIELAARFVTAPVIAITGTNGKSTTTSLIGAMLSASGYPTFCGGNLGRPLAEAVGERPLAGPGGRVVVELSSFQLETVASFRAHVAVLLNLSEDHLDRYATFEDYCAAKARIFERQTGADFSVVNGAPDQACCREMARSSPATLLSFASDPLPAGRSEGGWLTDDALVLRLPGAPREEHYRRARFELAGLHNLHNALAALLAARLAGATQEACARVLREFRGLPHRMEWIAEVDGVAFYNDSKATNVGSVVGSLRGFPRPVVLIAGGKDKGGDYAPLRQTVRQVCRAVVLIGAAADRIAEALKGSVPLHRAESLPEAVHLAAGLAQPTDAVVLSPACSSYDMFRDFEQRGEIFAEAVRQLAGRANG